MIESIETDELEISYEVTYEDEKKLLFDILYNKKTFLYFIVIPIIFILIFEVIMIIIGVLNQFSFNMKFTMILIPSFFLLLLILFLLSSLIAVKLNWRFRNKMPLHKKIIINDKWILIDEIFAKSKHSWDEISQVTNNMRNFIAIFIGGVFVHIIPKGVLEKETFQQLLDILNKKLKSYKIKIQ
ncbi:MAG: YcxB family protein [Asgard group archaeon]|nr:YcxB family protein [Asgard group archaeon]